LLAYILRRLILLPVVLWGLTLLIFGVSMLLTPEQRLATYIRDPAELQGGPEEMRRVIEKYGLDQPFYVQYGRWLVGILQGNLGWSQSTSMPVSEAISRFFPASAELALLACIPTVLGGIWLGTLAASHHDQLLDHMSRLFAIAGLSLPSFVFALLALMIFYGRLSWFPPGRLSIWALAVVNSVRFRPYTGMHLLDALLNGNLPILYDALRHLVLPVVTLAYLHWALLLRVTRSSMLETLRQDYVTTARGKGVCEKRVVKHHARRNALLPVTTVAGTMVSMMIGGVVITETVFNYNGLGRFAALAAQQLDMPAVLGFALLFGFVVIATNLVVDLVYAYLDPRVKLG
jgi:ABC-type dipeptide/oligopeptide/nickel transport system permease component